MKNGLGYIFLSYTFILTSCSYSENKNCSQLKNGEFFYKGSNPFEGNRIRRNDSVQVVTDEKTGTELKEEIVWIDSCSYRLFPFPGSKEDILNSDLFPIEVRILAVTKKYYTVHITSGDHKTNFDDTAWIVRLPN